MWAENEPAEDTLDLGVSAALVDAMGKPRPELEGSGFVPGPAEYLSRARVETLPAFVGADAAAPRRGDAARRSARDGGWRMRRSKRYAKPVDAADAGCRKDVAVRGVARRAAAAVLSTALGGRVAGVWVNEDGFIAVTAELSAVVEASITVGPEGSFACMVSTATRISRARSRTCGPSSGLPRSAWRRSACRPRGQQP